MGGFMVVSVVMENAMPEIEYTVREILSSDSVLKADGFGSHADAKEWAEKHFDQVFDSGQDAVMDGVIGPKTGAYVHKVYHHD